MLDYTRKDGSRLADHIEQIERTTGKRPSEFPDAPEVPDPVQAVWFTFWELSAARGSNGFGPNALTFTEIQAWSDLSDQPLSPWEVRALKVMDAEYLTAAAKLEK